MRRNYFEGEKQIDALVSIYEKGEAVIYTFKKREGDVFHKLDSQTCQSSFKRNDEQ